MTTRDELWREIAAERDYGPVLWPAQQDEIAEEVERRITLRRVPSAIGEADAEAVNST